jgi:hypothetical protein
VLEEGHAGRHDYKPEPDGLIDWIFDRWSPKWRKSRSVLIWVIAILMIVTMLLALFVFILFMIGVSGLGA